MSVNPKKSDDVLDQAKLAALTTELSDYQAFRQKVLIRNDMQHLGWLLLGTALVAGFLNVLVLNGQGVTEWSQLPYFWFSASGKGWLYTFLFRFLAFASVLSLCLGIGVSIWAPSWYRRQYKQAYRDFMARGWIAQSAVLGLTMDDDSWWIRKPVQVLAFSPQPKLVAKNWKSDLRLLRADVEDKASQLMIQLLLQDRVFHGARSVRSLRGHYDPPQVGGYTLVGFGPLKRLPSEGKFVVVAPPSDASVRNPESLEKLIFWIRDL
ncbi:hypothetical protein NXS08_02075 [Gleimia sp. 6138-11-ORH1]|uniref:hypothetical protein n=1 Tax=Gleimia sp. 6138-11-ORH1 TaxID=2973937 RepID=UPI0021694739|nr:hypothetical protein [Gleimia sp. 6138-11-ORH1]MCS4484278.1 hypothetical protein [Gleimia sp. 6138-11-ORH1]